MKNSVKIFFAVLSFLFIAFLNSQNALASNTDSGIFDAIDNIIKDIDFGDFSADNNIFQGDIKSNIYAIISGDFPFDLNTLTIHILNIFIGDVKALISLFFTVFAVALISSVVQSLDNLSTNKTLINLVNFVSISLIFTFIASTFSSCFESVTKSIQIESKHIDITIPIMLTLIISGGGNVSAKVLSPTVAYLLKGISVLVEKVFLPLVLLLFVFTIISSFSTNLRLNMAKNFIKSCFKWVMGITVILFNFFITIEGITTSLYDGVSIKALKYTLQNSVPIIGGVINGGFDITLAGALLIKNAIGVFSLLMVVSIALTPILKIASFMLILRLLSAIVEPIGDIKISQFLSGTADVLGYLNATYILTMLCFFVTYLVLIFCLGGAI